MSYNINDLVDAFFESLNYEPEGIDEHFQGNCLTWWQNAFYFWDGGLYSEIKKDTLNNLVTNYLRSQNVEATVSMVILSVLSVAFTIKWCIPAGMFLTVSTSTLMFFPSLIKASFRNNSILEIFPPL